MMKTMTFRDLTHAHQCSLPGGLLRSYRAPTPHTPVIPSLRPGRLWEAHTFPGLVNTGQLPPGMLRRRILRWVRYSYPAFIPRGGVCRTVPKDRVIH